MTQVHASVVWNWGTGWRDDFRLIGAQNVDIGGMLYDVEFIKDPYCELDQSSCPPEVSFDFHTREEAIVVSQA